MEELRGLGDITKMQFRFQDYWIQIHNIPLLCMSEAVGFSLGKMIGEVIEVDFGPSHSCLGKVL